MGEDDAILEANAAYYRAFAAGNFAAMSRSGVLCLQLKTFNILIFESRFLRNDLRIGQGGQAGSGTDKRGVKP
jgi:hypothetical protein